MRVVIATQTGRLPWDYDTTSPSEAEMRAYAESVGRTLVYSAGAVALGCHSCKRGDLLRHGHPAYCCECPVTRARRFRKGPVDA